jgi:hypothetical protein
MAIGVEPLRGSSKMSSSVVGLLQFHFHHEISSPCPSGRESDVLIRQLTDEVGLGDRVIVFCIILYSLFFILYSFFLP